MTNAGSTVSRAPRVLYSFPHRIGAERICLTAWQQAVGAAAAGADVAVLCGSVSRDLGDSIKVHTTLSLGKLKIPYRLLGRYRTLQLHDYLTARWLENNAENIDLVHCWPTASLRTIRAAKKHSIPSLLERPNAHTEYAYRAAKEENLKLGMELPEEHDHAFNQQVLEHEEAEYAECDYLLSPSDFVSETFLARSIPSSQILRHRYGFDDARFTPVESGGARSAALKVVYAGVCEPRKGLHYALEAWLASEASKNGIFQICGSFVPGYEEKIAALLAHPSVEHLGHRTDLPEIMRQADVFVLSSVEEGSALVTYEARGSGCVLLVSDASGAHCEHGVDSLVHPMRSVETLRDHFDRVYNDRSLLSDLRKASLGGREKLTWKAAGSALLEVYQSALT